METQAVTLGVMWYICFLFSTVCHEGAHALVAKWGGDLTAFRGGQVTLNPIPHIRREPFGLVLMPILSYAIGGWMIGWASAPYDPNWRRAFPRRATWMALAGPAANFAIMLAAAVAIRIGLSTGYLEAPQSVIHWNVTELAGGGTNLATTFLSILFLLNLLLGTFNLLPFPPLDGNVGVTVFLSKNAALRFVDVTRGQFSFLGILVAWFLFDRLFAPLLTLALNLLYPGAHYG